MTPSFRKIPGAISILTLAIMVPLFFLEDMKPFVICGYLFFVSSFFHMILKINETKYKERNPLYYLSFDHPNYTITMDKSFDNTDCADVFKNGAKVCRLFAGTSVRIRCDDEPLFIAYCKDPLVSVDIDKMPDGAFICNLYDGTGIMVTDLKDKESLSKICAEKYDAINKDVNGIYRSSIVSLFVFLIMFTVHSCMVLG